MNSFKFIIMSLSCLEMLKLFQFSQGDASYSVTVALWNKPWPPEIDWLDPYLNLSSLSQKKIAGIVLGDKLKKNTLYLTDSQWGRLVIWTMNPELADEHYFQHYANTNRTMFVCRALFPTRMDLARLFVSKGGRLVRCFNYEEGLFDGWMKEEEGDWGYIWSTYGGLRLVVALTAVGFITLTGLSGNILIIRAISVHKELQTPTNLFLASLALADLIITLFLPLYSVYSRYFRFAVRLTVYFCAILQFLKKSLYISSVYHLTTISFERFFAICYPMKVKSICTTKRAKLVICFLWITSSLIALPNALIVKESHAVPGHYCHSKGEYLVSDWYAVHMGSDFLLIFIIPFGLMVHNYVRIARTLLNSLKENKQLKEGVKTKVSQDDHAEKRVKVVKMLIAVVVIFVVCWTPVLMFRVYFGISKIFSRVAGSPNSLQTIALWLELLSYLNSIANAFVYYFTSDQFRRAFKTELSCGSCRNKDMAEVSVISRNNSTWKRANRPTEKKTSKSTSFVE